MSHSAVSEYDFEPVRGLPALLPKDETLLWQGAPQWRSMAFWVFHVRKVAIYFAVLLIWRFVSVSYDGATMVEAMISASMLLLLAFAAIALLLGLAWGYSRTTVYTITDKRIVMRFGVALPMTINLPFCLIESAALKVHGDGSGDLPLLLKPDQKIAYPVLWPNTRPWHFKRPQPMLRALTNVEQVAEILVQAMAEANSKPLAQVTRVKKSNSSETSAAAEAA